MATSNFYSEGDKSRAICESCAKLVTTTFGYRDVPFSDGTGTVKNILVGICDHCNTVASIPAQSTPAISKAREKATESLEASLPAPYLDLLDLACLKIDTANSIHLRKALLSYYVRQFASGAFEIKRLKLLEEGLIRQAKMETTARRRLSMKTTARLLLDFDRLVDMTSMKKTQALKAIIGAIQEDIVNDGRPELVSKIKEFSVFAEA